MAKVVLGLFDGMDKARGALDALEAAGFARENIDLRSGEELIRQGEATPAEADQGLWASIKALFAGSSSESRAADGVRESDALITVLTEDADAERAAQIIDAGGAEDIDSRAGAARATGSDTGADTAGAPAGPGGERRIAVTEEELRVGKRSVETGGVRVRSRVIERPVEQDVRLRDERIDVQRHAVDRPAAGGDAAFEEQSLEVHARSEEPVVEKRARVKEEVTVRKEAREREQRVRDTVRSTDVQIEQLSPEEEREFAGFAGEFESDWQAGHAGRTGLQYRDVEPGYRYGYHLGRSGRYAGDDWAAIESQVQGDWDRQGYGPWEHYREAVRAGWERTRH